MNQNTHSRLRLRCRAIYLFYADGGVWSIIRAAMKNKTDKALKAAYRHFQEASNQHGDAPAAVTMTAAGLHVLTGIVQDLFEEVEALRAEVKKLREEK